MTLKLYNLLTKIVIALFASSEFVAIPQRSTQAGEIPKFL